MTLAISIMELSGLELVTILVKKYAPLFSILLFVLLILLELLLRMYLSIKEDLSERDKYINRLIGKIYLKHEPIELDFRRKRKISFKLQLSSEEELVRPCVTFKDCEGFSISLDDKKSQQVTLNDVGNGIWLLNNIVGGRKILLCLILERDDSIKNTEREITISVMSNKTRGVSTGVICYF